MIMNKKIYYKYLRKYTTPVVNKGSPIEEAGLIFEAFFLLNNKFGLKIPNNFREYNMSCEIEDIVDFVLDNQSEVTEEKGRFR